MVESLRLKNLKLEGDGGGSRLQELEEKLRLQEEKESQILEREREAKQKQQELEAQLEKLQQSVRDFACLVVLCAGSSSSIFTRPACATLA